MQGGLIPLNPVTPRGAKLVAAAVAVVVALAGAVVPIARASRAGADALAMSSDLQRTGWYPDEAQLAPSTINDAAFGQLFSTTLDGQVYAQPLVSQGKLLAVTENNSAYGLDAVTGTITWHHNYGAAWDPAVLSCGDLVPQIGSTATPVINPSTRVAYFTTKIATSPDSSSSAWYLHAVKVATGVEQTGFPVLIQGNASNDAGTTFNPQLQMQRTGLALVNGVVYMGFGSHCDAPPWLGWVVGVSTTTHAITSMWADETGQSSGGGAGIWQSGSAPVVDASGNLYYVTGNGTSPPAGPAGGAQPQGMGECVIKLDTATGGTDGALSLSDWFCPANADLLNSYDGDLGSGGLVELPATFESANDNFPILVTAGKDGRVYLLDRNDLGGEAQGPGGTDAVVSEVGPFGGVWSKPAVWPGDGGYVYLPTASPGGAPGGSSGSLNVFKRIVDGSGNVSLSLVAQSSDAYGFSSGSAVVTSDGTTAGSAVVWIVHAADASGAGATLRAYEAVPQAGHLVQLWSTPLGTASKFMPPTVDSGRLYLGTCDGAVVAFGARAGAPPLHADLVQFTPTSLGSADDATATFTATGTVTINSISVQNSVSSTPAVFAAGSPSAVLPTTLTSGQQLTVPMTFTPAALGQQHGTLTANTGAGAVDLPLDGTGTAPTVPIGTSPPSIDFGTLASGGNPSTSSVDFTNNGGSTFVVNGLDLPGGPFSVIGAPATDGSVSVAPGDSIGLSIRFTPPTTSGNFPQTFTGQLALHTSVGDVVVPVRGTAAPPAQITISPAALHFGNVPLGRSATLSFVVGNAGGTPLSLLKSKPPVANRFSAATALAEGTVIPAHTSKTVSVRFSPTAVGQLRDRWIITGDDGSGPQTVTFSATGARLATVPSPASGGWKLNGAARMAGSALQLTPAVAGKAGSAFWPHVLSSSGIDASFTETMHGGTGADGLTLAFADASFATPASLGGTGAMLGFGGIRGVAVALDTFPNVTNTSANSIGVVTGVSGVALRWTTIDAGIPLLRSGSHLITVHALNGTLSVLVDGLAAFHLAVKLPPKIYLGFTGATGGGTDVHSVANVQITAHAPPVPPPPPPPPPPAVRHGFRLVGADGGVFTFGDAAYYGSTGAMHLNAPIVGIAADPKTGGYWLVASDGGIFAFHAPFFGSTGAMHLNAPIVGMAPTADGGGYWLVARDGGVFAFGDARFHGSTGGMHLNAPIVGMAADAKTGGYWLVASDGGVFAFGAPYEGSAGAVHLGAPIVGVAPKGDGDGYWLVARDGGVFHYGRAPAYGHPMGQAVGTPVAGTPFAGMLVTAGEAGYVEVAADGSVFAFGSTGYNGARLGATLHAPIVGVAR